MSDPIIITQWNTGRPEVIRFLQQQLELPSLDALQAFLTIIDDQAGDSFQADLIGFSQEQIDEMEIRQGLAELEAIGLASVRLWEKTERFYISLDHKKALEKILFNQVPPPEVWERIKDNVRQMEERGQRIDEERIALLRSLPYQDYLQSDHWKVVRIMALQKADFRCQLCNSKDNLHVHHKTYKTKGCEQPGDVIVLCKTCHAHFHFKLG